MPSFRIVFTGGTALSKAHGRLERFSEDMDFRVLVEGKLNRRVLSEFKQAVVQALRNGSFEFDISQICAPDESRFFSVDIEYPSHFMYADALRPHIQIELTVRSIRRAIVDPDSPSDRIAVWVLNVTRTYKF